MEEKKIGEVFEYKGTKLIVVINDSAEGKCGNCAFNTVLRSVNCSELCNNGINCLGNARSDKTNVRFVPVNELGRMACIDKDMATKLYKLGGDFLKLSLSVYNPSEFGIVRSWDDFVLLYGKKVKYSDAVKVVNDMLVPETSRNMIKLELLRDHYRNGWVPTSVDCGYSIKVVKGENYFIPSLTKSSSPSDLLSLPDESTASEFSKYFSDLIIKVRKYL